VGTLQVQSASCPEGLPEAWLHIDDSRRSTIDQNIFWRNFIV